MWEEAGMHAQEGDHHSISHTTTVDHVDRTRIAWSKASAFPFGALHFLINGLMRVFSRRDLRKKKSHKMRKCNTHAVSLCILTFEFVVRLHCS